MWERNTSIPVGSIRWSPNGKYISYAIEGPPRKIKNVKVINTRKPDTELEIEIPRKAIPLETITWSNNSEYLAIPLYRKEKYELMIWQLADPKNPKTIKIKKDHIIRYVAWSKDDEYIAIPYETSGQEENTANIEKTMGIEIYDVDKLNLKNTFKGFYPGAITWIKNDELIAGGKGGTYIQALNPQKDKLIKKPRKTYTPINKIKQTEKQEHIIGATFGNVIFGDTIIWYWDTETLKLKKKILRLGVLVDVTWSPDGKYIAGIPHASYAEKGKVYMKINIWDTKTGKKIKEKKFEGRNRSIYSLSWSPEGKHIATLLYNYENTEKYEIIIWNPQTRRKTKTIQVT